MWLRCSSRAQEARVAKPAAADEASHAAAMDAESRFCTIAITNYKRCLQVCVCGGW